MCQYKQASDLISVMEGKENPSKRAHLMRFFKTGVGEYGEGDRFLGLTTPETRSFVRCSRDMSLTEVRLLLYSPWHEVRLCGFLILVDQFERLSISKLTNDAGAMLLRDAIVEFYLKHCRQANNWDLVDLSCYKTLGRWLTLPSNYSDSEKRSVMDRLAFSDNLWEQRISMVSTMGVLKTGDPSYTLRYAEVHLHHPHDLMQKAVGWMLREMGKRCGVHLLRDFLTAHACDMPRTTLRYAIEHLSPTERRQWLEMKNV